METLPGEITSDILVRLPIKTLCTLKCVSKLFKSLITSPHFANSHRRRFSATNPHPQLLLATTSSLYTLTLSLSRGHFPPPIRLQIPLLPLQNNQLIGSCHGLVCLLHGSPTHSFSLLNPTTREHKSIPPPCPTPPDANLTLSGFGYDRIAQDYKVIMIATDNTMVAQSMAQVYSANVNSWKSLDQKFPFRVLPWVKPVYVNGVVHWLGFGGKFPPVHKIIGFDFVDESFKILPFPEKVGQRSVKCLAVLGGKLCVFSGKNDPSCFELWEMMEYGVGESWTKGLSMPRGGVSNAIDFLYPLTYLNERILIRVDHNNLVLYEPGKGMFVKVEVNLHERRSGREVYSGLEVAVYEESIVSPCGSIGRDEARIYNQVE